jgi:hypothetical protein
MAVHAVEVVLENAPIEQVRRVFVPCAGGLERRGLSNARVDLVVDLPVVCDAIADGDRSDSGDASDTDYDAECIAVRRPEVPLVLEIEILGGGPNVHPVKTFFMKAGDQSAERLN